MSLESIFMVSAPLDLAGLDATVQQVLPEPGHPIVCKDCALYRDIERDQGVVLGGSHLIRLCTAAGAAFRYRAVTTAAAGSAGSAAAVAVATDTIFGPCYALLCLHVQGMAGDGGGGAVPRQRGRSSRQVLATSELAAADYNVLVGSAWSRRTVIDAVVVVVLMVVVVMGVGMLMAVVARAAARGRVGNVPVLSDCPLHEAFEGVKSISVSYQRPRVGNSLKSRVDLLDLHHTSQAPVVIVTL